MNRFLISLSLSFFVVQAAHSQQFSICMDLVANSGGQGIQGNQYLAWTVGEAFSTTLHGAGYAFTQGFLQPDACGLSFVGANDLRDWGISLFPNPTDGPAVLRFSPEKNGRLLAFAFDLLGRPVLENQSVTAAEGTLIDASSWPAGIYFLLLKDPATQASATFRLIRL